MGRSSDAGNVLADTEGRLHHLILPAINSGGQGDVYQTQEPNIGVKILRDGEGATDVIRNVRRLPIEDLTSIAAPLSTLRERTGYVMVWLRGMATLGDIRLPLRSTRDQILDWYVATGGLRRRLALSARLAEVIADLHSRGLVYVDLNMKNVMVSDTGGAVEVRLIDLDNLRWATDRTLSVRTPDWAAPEIFARQPPSRHSDAYSLALVVFTVLTGYHPFYDGDLVRYTPDDSQIRLEAKSGMVPSTIDANDTLNATDHHLFPLEVTLNAELLTMFQQTFGAGRHDFGARATAASMRRKLWAAHDWTVGCECGFTTYFNAGACASCHRTFDDAFAVEILASPSSPAISRIAVGASPVVIERRHLPLPVEPRSRHDEVVRLSVERGSVYLESLSEWSCGTQVLRHGGQTELEGANGSIFTLRAVARAS